MKNNLDHLLDSVEWEELDWPGVVDGTFATHKGVLKIFDFSFRCYVLNDGSRVFDAEDVKKFFTERPDEC